MLLTSLTLSSPPVKKTFLTGINKKFLCARESMRYQRRLTEKAILKPESNGPKFQILSRCITSKPFAGNAPCLRFSHLATQSSLKTEFIMYPKLRKPAKVFKNSQEKFNNVYIIVSASVNI